MHKIGKKDLTSAELETSMSPASVMTANGEVQTKEEATVNVKQLDLFVEKQTPLDQWSKTTSHQKSHKNCRGSCIHCQARHCAKRVQPTRERRRSVQISMCERLRHHHVDNN